MSKMNATMILQGPARVLQWIPPRVWTCLILSAGLVACATESTTPSTQGHWARTAGHGLARASALYEKRDFGAALKEFDRLIAADDTSANSRRLSYLGKALIYLGNNEEWHNLDNAKLALNDAGRVLPDSDKEFLVETDMFMDAILALIGSQSAYDALQTKTSGSRNQIAQLQKQTEDLSAERDTLLEALEKLKALTLGN